MYSSDDSNSESEDSKGYNNQSKFYFWNNWIPPKQKKTITKLKASASPLSTKCSFAVRNAGTLWLPPDEFGYLKLAATTGSLAEEMVEREQTTNAKAVRTVPREAEVFDWNGDWGERCCDFSIVEEGDAWDLIHPGIFGTLKLSVNSDGVVIGYANAEYSKFDGSEKIFILITSELYLRKLLGISNYEWVALTDAVKIHDENISYNAMANWNLQKLTPLQQLWHVICNRRHHLPSVCIRMRRHGVQKMTQFLQILPRFLVTDIRTCAGKSIS